MKVVVLFFTVITLSFCTKTSESSIKPTIPSNSQKAYFVSPSGSDSNPGTKEKPWKTMAKAADYLIAGDTAIFEDGEYPEMKAITIKNSGTKEKPIVFKSENRHKAKIVFSTAVKETAKLRIQDREYIELQDFEITQREKGTKTSDILITCRGSQNIIISGNKIHYAFEEGIKASRSKGVLIKDNYIFDMRHEGIDVLNVEDIIIEGNEIREVGRVGIMVKGGARDIKVFNNIIKNKDIRLSTAAITIGGETDNTSPFDISTEGYEGYNILAWNNVIVSENPDKMRIGIAFMGAKDSHAYNNVIVGADNGISFSSIPGIKNGWFWNPRTTNPVVKNNIIMDIKNSALSHQVGSLNEEPINLIHDNNLYFNIGETPPVETNGIYEDPLFYDKNNDWRLMTGSPAKGAGAKLPSKIMGFHGVENSIEFRDFDNGIRSEPWNIGIY